MDKWSLVARAAMVETWRSLGLGRDELVECLHCGKRFGVNAASSFDGYTLRCPTSGCDGFSWDWFPAKVLDGDELAYRRMLRAQDRGARRAGVVARRAN